MKKAGVYEAFMSSFYQVEVDIMSGELMMFKVRHCSFLQNKHFLNLSKLKAHCHFSGWTHWICRPSSSCWTSKCLQKTVLLKKQDTHLQWLKLGNDTWGEWSTTTTCRHQWDDVIECPQLNLWMFLTSSSWHDRRLSVLFQTRPVIENHLVFVCIDVGYYQRPGL